MNVQCVRLSARAFGCHVSLNLAVLDIPGCVLRNMQAKPRPWHQNHSQLTSPVCRSRNTQQQTTGSEPWHSVGEIVKKRKLRSQVGICGVVVDSSLALFVFKTCTWMYLWCMHGGASSVDAKPLLLHHRLTGVSGANAMAGLHTHLLHTKNPDMHHTSKDTSIFTAPNGHHS